MLLASGQVVANVDDAIFVGELALTGDLRPTRGVLPIVGLARDRGMKRAFVPVQNIAEASLVPDIAVFPVESLSSLAAHLLGAVPIARQSAVPPPAEVDEPEAGTDFAEVIGQEHAKRALEVAAAGGHNLVMRGPPGSGKTLLARAMPSILPPMTEDEAMDVTRIYSVAGLLPSGVGLLRTPPFRAPHHTVSNAGLIGGGSVPRPGEITLAHRGVLFLDELLEFDLHVLEMLRQPLEDRIVTISRARTSCTFPANFILLSSLNPCPCGYYGDPTRDCTCTEQSVVRYQRRLSGPLLDRIDLFVDVPRVPYEKLVGDVRGEPSSAIRERIQRARTLQAERFRPGASTTTLNAHMTPHQVREFAQSRLDDAGNEILRVAVERLDLSARAFHRILKVGRTIADLAASESIEVAHIGEAIQYRQRME